MANLLTAMQSWRYEAAALSKCKRVALNNPKVEHDAKENERPHVGDDAKEEGGPQDGMHEGGSERAMASTREKECADDGEEEVGPETQALWAVDSK